MLWIREYASYYRVPLLRRVLGQYIELPKSIGTELEAAYALCSEKKRVEISKEDAQQLADRVMELLRKISRVIKEVTSSPLAA